MGSIAKNEKWLLEPQRANIEVSKAVRNKTYVGIDFGTSTTVVSIITSDRDGKWHPETLEIRQQDIDGGETEQSIVNTVLLWEKDTLIFGQPAYKYKGRARPGVNLFSSFKMELGLDIPTFPDTLLSSKKRQSLCN